MKKLCLVIVQCFLLVSKTHAIGVRQLQEFNNAKKEVEQTLQLYRQGKSVSDESRKKLEVNLTLIDKIDKQAADTYRIQVPRQTAEKKVFDPGTTELTLPQKVPKESKEKAPMVEVPLKFTPALSTINEEDQEVVQQEPEQIQTPPSTPRNIAQEIAKQPQQESFSVQNALPVPVVTSKSEDRQTPIIESQSPWTVPIPKEQKKIEQKKENDALEVQLKKFESAIDQAKINLDKMDFTSAHGVLTHSMEDFLKWDRNIDNYSATLQGLKSNNKLYQEKTEKIKQIKQLFVTKLYERILFVIELIRGAINPLRKTLKKNQEKQPTVLSGNKQEFQNVSYQVFFGLLGKKEWQNPGTRKNLAWFKDNVQKKFEMYWNQELANSSKLLFEYHNKQKIMTDEQSDMLKVKIDALHGEIKEYKTLLSGAYNTMMGVLTKLPADDQNNQMKLIEKDYGTHLALLDIAEKTLKKDFLNKLWLQ